MTGIDGKLKIVLRLEALVTLVLSVLLYRYFSFSWGDFAWFFLVPDLALLGYLHGPVTGAALYNISHSMLGAITAGILGLLSGSDVLIQGALIWAAHIGFDRALGYGLKYSQGFRYTHLGRIGKETPSQGRDEMKI